MVPGRSDDPAVYAEQALLGALLTRPAHMPHVAGHLQPSDFYHPAHHALYQALTDQHHAGHPATGENATRADHDDWFHTTTRTAATTSRVATLAYCHSLLDYCPHPDHAPTYARLVLAGSIRRTIATHAHRLAHGARSDALANQGPNNSLRETPHFTDAVRQAIARWGGTSQRPIQLPDSPSSVTASSPPSQQDDEAALIGALAGHPDTLSTIAPWLRPEDFTSLTHQTLYRSMCALHHRGDPIDTVTLVWEAPHRGGVTSHLTTDDLTRLTTPNGADPDYYAARLLQAALIRTTQTAAHTIRALTADPSIAPSTLLRAAQQALTAIAHNHHRWQQATHAAQQPRAATPTTASQVTPRDTRASPTPQPPPHRRGS